VGNVCATTTYQDDSGDSILGGNLGILHALNPLDENGQLGVLLDEVDVIPNKVVVLIPRDSLRDSSRFGRLLPARPLFFRRRRWGVRDSLGSLIQSPFRSRSSVDGEHDSVTSEFVYFFEKTFGGGSVFVEVELGVRGVTENNNQYACGASRDEPEPALTWKIKLCP